VRTVRWDFLFSHNSFTRILRLVHYHLHGNCGTDCPRDLDSSGMIAIDLQTFRQSRENGTVTGVIYVELDSGPFPEKG